MGEGIHRPGAPVRGVVKRLLVFLPLLFVLPGCWGIVLNADLQGSTNAAQSLGAHICRAEFPAMTGTQQMDSAVDYMMTRGCQPYLLAGFANQNVPTSAEAGNLASWATRYGPGGPFMDGRDSRLAVKTIEFGNESSYRNGAPDGPGAGDDWWASQQYLDRACNYGQKAQAAVFAVSQANSGVKVSVQADHGGSGSPNWVNRMLTCGPGLKGSVAAWTTHPYGPTPQNKINAAKSQTAAAGADPAIKIDVTEYGIATDNGNNLNDNYGWPTNLTYAQAADALQTGANLIDGTGKVRVAFIYSAHDLQPSGTGQREHYFGCLKNTNAEKGAFSAKCRDLLAN